MNIIFGDAVKQLPKNYITLELDTIVVQPINHRVTTWCVLEDLTQDQTTTVEVNKKLHSDLIIEYRNQNWKICVDNINQLLGQWGGQVDTFYQELLKRIENYKKNPPEPGWDGTVHRNLAQS